MNPKLDVRQWIIASIAVFIFASVWAFLTMRLILTPLSPSLVPAPPEATEMMTQRLLIYLSRAINALLFVYIFTKGYEGKPGVGEGVRFGLLIGLFMQLPYFLWSSAMATLPTDYLVIRGVLALADAILSGLIVGLIYKGQPKPVP
jgi:hypothetical protein